MAKFLIHAKYTQAGFQGVVKEGFVAREAYIRSLVESIGGKVEAFYFAYGDDDVIVVIDADPSAAAAMSLVINQSGSVQIRTTPLLTAAEMDEARTRIPDYRVPGA
ncbi:GYD domain-containing protein [Saccharothrix deserti]|uniref:GYD domain-containing protein n=1 Tax=Saccharothrix deserti TaxID=2593674 RepID=UPI00131BA088|nr:GYD domain-containing protein [Saccharothrix deserti]